MGTRLIISEHEADAITATFSQNRIVNKVPRITELASRLNLLPPIVITEPELVESLAQVVSIAISNEAEYLSSLVRNRRSREASIRLASPFGLTVLAGLVQKFGDQEIDV